MAVANGRGVRVEIGMTESAPITITGVTAAKPPVVTTGTTHGLAAKSLAYVVSVANQPELEGQAIRFSAAAGTSLTLEDLDLTSSAAGGAGSLVPVATWGVYSEATDYNKSGGEGNPQDVTTLVDKIQQQINGTLSAETVGFTARQSTISSAVLQRIRETAKNQGYLVVRITLHDGNVRFFRGQPSLPTEALSQQSTGQATLSFTVKGFWCEGAV